MAHFQRKLQDHYYLLHFSKFSCLFCTSLQTDGSLFPKTLNPWVLLCSAGGVLALLAWLISLEQIPPKNVWDISLTRVVLRFLFLSCCCLWLFVGGDPCGCPSQSLYCYLKENRFIKSRTEYYSQCVSGSLFSGEKEKLLFVVYIKHLPSFLYCIRIVRRASVSY